MTVIKTGQRHSITTNPISEHEILGLYKSSLPIRRISEITGTSVAGIYRILEKYGIKPHRRHVADIYDRIIQYHDSGTSVQRISELTGYSIRHIHKILARKP